MKSIERIYPTYLALTLRQEVCHVLYRIYLSKNVGGYPVGVPTYVTAEQLRRLMGDEHAPEKWPPEAVFRI